MDTASQIAPPEDLYGLVESLIESAMSLKNSEGDLLFSGGITGKPRKMEVLALFYPSFGSDLSRWKSGKGIHPNFPVVFTKKLINIFSGLNRGRNSCVVQDSLEKFAAVLDHWKSKPESLELLLKKLTEFKKQASIQINELNAAEIDTVVQVHTAALADSFGPEDTGATDIRELFLADFEKPQDTEFREAARRYLQGQPPSPSVAAHVAVARQDADEVWNLANSKEIVIVHGPLGEGTSTILLQVAKLALNAGKRVFWSADSIVLEQFETFKAWKEKPVVIVDAVEELHSLPKWLVDSFSGEGGCIFFGCHTSNSERILKQVSKRDNHCHQIASIDAASAAPFIEQVACFQAHPPGLDRTEIERLFLDGLRAPHGLGGLWPAQYQATSGEPLDHRIRKLVDSLSGEAQLVLANIAFLNLIGLHSKSDKFPRPHSRFVAQMLKVLDLADHTLSNCLSILSNFPATWDGELKLSRGIGYTKHLSNPIIEFRHPALTDSIFRWCFGAKSKNRGSMRFWRWEFYGAAIDGLEEKGPSLIPAFAIVRQMFKDYQYDLKAHGELERQLVLLPDYPAFGDIVLHVIEQMQSKFASSWASADPKIRRINLIKSQLLSHPSRGQANEDLVKAKERADIALAGAIEEHDSEVLCDVAELARQNEWKLEIPGSEPADWRSLLVTAAAVAHSEHKQITLDRQFNLLIEYGNHEDMPKINELLGDAVAWRSSSRDKYRMNQTRRVLNMVRRRQAQGVEYLIKFGDISATNLQSIQSIYREFWWELLRYRESMQVGETWPTRVSGIVKSILDDWFMDCQLNPDAWDGDVIKLVESAAKDGNELPKLIDAHLKFFPERR